MRASALLTLLLWVSSVATAGESEAEILAASCRGCHTGTGSELPVLAQLSPEEMEKRLLAFKSGETPATLMDRIIRGYTEQEIKMLAQTLGKAQ